MDDIDSTLPEVVQNFLRSGAALENIGLDQRGKWTHEGLDFENERIIGLFNRSVNRTPGGTWILEVGRFTYPIEVEDTGFFVERVDLDADPPMLQLSDETSEPLMADSLSYGSEGRLYCRVKDGEFRARFKKPAYYAIAEHVEEQNERWLLRLHGREHLIKTT